MVLSTKENIDAYEPILIVNLPPVIFIVIPKKQVITDNIQRAWYPNRSVAVVTYVGVPVEEALSEIVMNTRRAVICL